MKAEEARQLINAKDNPERQKLNKLIKKYAIKGYSELTMMDSYSDKTINSLKEDGYKVEVVKGRRLFDYMTTISW